MFILDNLNTFKERIKELCREYGISQKFLCDKIGRAKTYLNDVWNGKTSIKDEDLETIADILHTNSAYLRGETDNPEGIQDMLVRLQRDKNRYFFDENSSKDDLEVMTRSMSINSNLRGDVEKAKIIERISSLDTATLLKLEKILDMILEEK